MGGDARALLLAMNGRAIAAPPTGDPAWPPSAWDRLDEVSVPTLVVVPRLDIAPDTVAELVDHIPGAQVVQLPQSAPLPMLDDPDGFCDAVRPFLDTHR